MRVRRTTRRELKKTLSELQTENEKLRQQLTNNSSESIQVSDHNAFIPEAPDNTLTAPIIVDGFPTKSAKLQAHNLKEAKAMAMEYLARCK